MANPFSNIFKTAPVAPVVPVVPANANSAAAVVVPVAGAISDQKATTNADGKMAGTNQVLENPMDVYGKLWDTAGKTPDVAPSFTLDDKTLTEASGKLNFTRDISPELMTKATTGDVSALLEIMNLVGQQSYKTALAHSSALTDRFVGARSEYDLKNVGTQVKTSMVGTELASIPNASHPVVQAELKRIGNAMQAANPDATPQEIAKGVTKYMTDLTSALTGDTKAAEIAKATAAMPDWESYLKQG